MTKPSYAPIPGNVWALKLYPGGRAEWRSVAKHGGVVVLAAAEDAARLLRQWHAVYVDCEETAAAALRLAKGQGYERT